MADVLTTSGPTTVTTSTTPLIALTAVQSPAYLWVQNSGASTCTIEVAVSPDGSATYSPVVIQTPELKNDAADAPTGLAAGTEALFIIPDTAGTWVRVRGACGSGSTTITASIISQSLFRRRTHP